MRDWIVRDLEEATTGADLDLLAERMVVYRTLAGAPQEAPSTRFCDLREDLPIRRRGVRLGAAALVLSGAAAAAALVLVVSQPSQRPKGEVACCPPVALEVKAWRGSTTAPLPDRRLDRDAPVALEVRVHGPVWIDSWAVNLEDHTLRPLAPPKEVAGPRALVAGDVTFDGPGRRLLVVFATGEEPDASRAEVADALADLGQGRGCTLAGRPCSVAMYELEVE